MKSSKSSVVRWRCTFSCNEFHSGEAVAFREPCKLMILQTRTFTRAVTAWHRDCSCPSDALLQISLQNPLFQLTPGN